MVTIKHHMTRDNAYQKLKDVIMSVTRDQPRVDDKQSLTYKDGLYSAAGLLIKCGEIMASSYEENGANTVSRVPPGR